MSPHEHFMQHCLDLAVKGMGNVAPNPMVGCVIVHEGKIIGEGYHRQYGGPHAEVNAVKNVLDENLLQDATLYVNLEPCSHQGKTPPCTELIISKKIPRVVIGCRDENPLVKGKGIEQLRENGVDVTIGVLEKESKFLNRRFLTFHSKKRPYIILKWAQSEDGFIDHNRDDNNGERAIVSSPESQKLVHEWRANEAAIMVGTNTVLADDPQLTVRLAEGRSPVRISFDRVNRIPLTAKILDGNAPTIIFSGEKHASENAEYIVLDFSNDPIEQALNIIYEKKLLSVLVEGGAAILRKFLEKNLWDEARVFIAPKKFDGGVFAPALQLAPAEKKMIGPDQLLVFYNVS